MEWVKDLFCKVLNWFRKPETVIIDLDKHKLDNFEFKINEDGHIEGIFNIKGKDV